MFTFHLKRFVFIRYSCTLSPESALLSPHVSNVGSHSGDISWKFIEPIAFKQVMLGSFNYITVAQRAVYVIFRIEMVIWRAAICFQSSIVYLANAFAIAIKQRDTNHGRVEYALKSANTCCIFGILRQFRLMVETSCSRDHT